MKKTFMIMLFILSSCLDCFTQDHITITIDGSNEGRIFEGIGGVSAGASTRLLFDYTDPYRSDILDFLFKPKFGAAFQHLKIEIGSGENSTCGSEPSHAITREEIKNPVNRGYELWFMKEARDRNPNIILDCLPWCYPGWLSGIFSQDAADWFAAFLDAAKIHYGLDIDWISAAQNENGTNRDWIVNQLRPTLNKKGYTKVKLQAPDDDSEYWQIFDQLATDQEYNQVIDAVGYHYLNGREPWEIDQVSGKDATPAAKASGKPLWASEDWSMSGKQWNGRGAMFLARLINKFYIRDQITKTLIWCPIDAIYEGLPWEDTGAMSADKPWGGYYEVWPAIWAVAHTTQFAEPGWQYLDKGCGLITPATWKGSSVTLKHPQTNDWSMIICTDHAANFNINVGNGLKKGPVYVWHSDAEEQFICMDTLAAAETLTYNLETTSLYTFTTTTGQTKGYHDIPEDAPFPFPYQEDYNSYQPGDTPKYHSDQKGTFEVFDLPSHGLCLKQVVPQQGHNWHYMTGVIKPYTVLGDHHWTDYAISADVLIQNGDVEIGGRFSDQNNLNYRFVLDRIGAWQVKNQQQVLASGNIAQFDAARWHRMKLVMRGSHIQAYLDGESLASVVNDWWKSGMAYLASTYDPNCFDNILVDSVPSTGMGERKGLIPDEVELSQNYPNPLNGRRQIRVELPEADNGQISITVNGNY